MMRTGTAQVEVGHVLTTGEVKNGPLTCRREVQGRYRLYAPPGKKILGIVAVGVSFPQWAFVQQVDLTESTVMLIFCNQAATVEVDANFRYTISLVA